MLPCYFSLFISTSWQESCVCMSVSLSCSFITLFLLLFINSFFPHFGFPIKTKECAFFYFLKEAVIILLNGDGGGYACVSTICFSYNSNVSSQIFTWELAMRDHDATQGNPYISSIPKHSSSHRTLSNVSTKRPFK